MPELPEVETTIRGVEPLVVGKILADCDVRVPKLRWAVPSKELNTCVGAKVERIWRRSKYMLWEFDHGMTMILHLGMSGRLNIAAIGDDVEKHEHVILDFVDADDEDEQVSIRLRDPRKFGAVLMCPTKEVCYHKVMTVLGPEPLDDDFSATYLYEKLKRKKMAIKPALMDAKLVVGVGNIYANEALFRAGIHPEKSCDKITRKQAVVLHQNIQDVLQEAIAAGGSSLKDFAQADGALGYFYKAFAVYDRDGKPCVRCNGIVEKITLAGRGTCFCKSCQK